MVEDGIAPIGNLFGGYPQTRGEFFLFFKSRVWILEMRVKPLEELRLDFSAQIPFGFLQIDRSLDVSKN